MQELAEICGYSVPYLSQVLNGVKEYKNDHMKEKMMRRIFDGLEKLCAAIIEGAKSYFKVEVEINQNELLREENGRKVLQDGECVGKGT